MKMGYLHMKQLSNPSRYGRWHNVDGERYETMRGGVMRAGDDLTAHQVWDTEALRIYVPELRNLPCDQPHPPLHTIRHGGDYPQ